jgi:hypothetical protein
MSDVAAPGGGPFDSCDRDMADIRAWLAAAQTHVHSARAMLDPAVMDGGVDPAGAISLCHTAVRKAITARMNFDRLKVASGAKDKHKLVVEYGAANISVVDEAMWKRVGALRTTRNEADYTNPTKHRISNADARDAIAIADHVVNQIAIDIMKTHRAEGGTG